MLVSIFSVTECATFGMLYLILCLKCHQIILEDWMIKFIYFSLQCCCNIIFCVGLNALYIHWVCSFCAMFILIKLCCYYIFTASSPVSAILAVVILSVLLSVPPSVGLSVTRVLCDKTMEYTGYFATPFPSEICAQSDPPPFENADFDRFLLITPQPQKIAMKVQLWRTGSRPRAFQRVTYVIPISPPKGGLKSDLLF